MRVYLQTTASNSIVPYDYQHYLTGAIHKWLGINAYHDRLSLYSFSWLQGAKASSQGLEFSKGATWFISAHEVDFIKRLIAGIQEDPFIAFGMQVVSVTIQDTPDFGNQYTFMPASPIFIKRKFDQEDKYFLFDDPQSAQYLTDTLSNKLSKAGLDDPSLLVYFERTAFPARTKMVHYKGIGIRGSHCPVTIHGQPSSLGFAWNVGLGNSTGIGFGSLK